MKAVSALVLAVIMLAGAPASICLASAEEAAKEKRTAGLPLAS